MDKYEQTLVLFKRLVADFILAKRNSEYLDESAQRQQGRLFSGLLALSVCPNTLKYAVNSVKIFTPCGICFSSNNILLMFTI